MVKDMATCSTFRFNQPYREDNGFRALLGFKFPCIIHNLYVNEFRTSSVRKLLGSHLWWRPDLDTTPSLRALQTNLRSEESTPQKKCFVM
jgi:hypothetical protein